jgi:hypothetical protein
MARNLIGPIPDDHFENEPTYPPKNVSPLSQALLDHIAAVKAERRQVSTPVTRRMSDRSRPRQ